MKFLEQVRSYQRALVRRSRFFSSIMLVSGVGIAATAPFLSYEVSKIECAEKGTLPVSINCDDLSKSLRTEIETLNIDLEKLGQTKQRLEDQLITVERENDQCKKQLSDCEKRESNPGNNDELAACEQEKERLQLRYEKLVEDRNNYKERFEECIKQRSEDRSDKINISGVLHHKETFNFNGDKFSVSINFDDVGARYQFYKNGTNVTKNLKSATSGSVRNYVFSQNKKNYIFGLGRIRKGTIPFQIKPE